MNLEDSIRRLAEQIYQLLPAGASLPAGFQENLRLAVQSVLARSELVTREEFDAQTAVLRHTREQVKALELELAALEARLAAAPDSAMGV